MSDIAIIVCAGKCAHEIRELMEEQATPIRGRPTFADWVSSALFVGETRASNANGASCECSPLLPPGAAMFSPTVRSDGRAEGVHLRRIEYGTPTPQPQRG